MSFVIGGLQKTSLLDYPNQIACIVFTNKCNYRCGYCHNPELVENQQSVITVRDFFDFLNTRKNKIDGVVITGGEPTMQSGLIDFIKEIKRKNFLVKLDTNGSNSKVLKELLNQNLLNYVAMDIKAPLEKYHLITNIKANIEEIQKSISLIKNNAPDYEFRTTVLKEQLTFGDFEEIGKLIQGSKRYYLQPFVHTKILDETLSCCHNYEKEEAKEIVLILKKYIKEVNWRY